MGMNERVFVYVIIFLGTALLACVGGIIYLVASSHTTPDILQNIASGVVAGLIGLLANPTKSGA
jgi:hypothetical protein